MNTKQKSLEKLGRVIITNTHNTNGQYMARLISYDSGQLEFSRGGSTKREAIDRLYRSVKEYLWHAIHGRTL